jgi:glycerol uptake facilitator protein
MSPYVAEFVGTAILILLGDGVVANVVLAKTKGHNAGWIVINIGWGMAVFVAVWCVADVSGAHINPAVTLGLAAAGKFQAGVFTAADVPWFIAAQLLGAMAGAALVYVFYRDHFAVTEDPNAKLGTFCTAPAIRNAPINLFCEVVATFVLVFAVLFVADPAFKVDVDGAELPAEFRSVKLGLGTLGALPVGLLVLAIGMSLGGTTGYAINPARDLGPRIAHALLPIPGKRDSDWSYSWIPVVGPIIGGLLAALAWAAQAGLSSG